MSKLIKIQRPKILEELCNGIITDEKVKNKLVENITINDKEQIGFTIDSCIFKNVKFNNCSLQNVDLMDTRFENCDLSNIDFSRGSIHRVEFIDCKLLGAKFDEGSLIDVLFQGALGKYSNFAFAKFKGVNIINCNFQEAVFQQVKKGKLAFIDTDLTSSYFNKTSLDKMDLTTCEIGAIDVEIDDIAGAIVTPMQALDLTRLMRLTVK